VNALSHGWLLGGRVRHQQPRTGHRTGLEPVLLAAAVPARAGAHVLEGGTGSGAGLLCLAARVPGITGMGIERDPALVAIARANVAANAFAGLAIVQADLTAAWPEEALPRVTFDHAFANPPWHDAAGTISPDAGREAARRGAPGLLEQWVASLVRPLRHHGSLTLALSAGLLPAALAACQAAGCGSPAVLPLWPKAGREAKLLLLQSVKGGRGPSRLLPGLVLHAPDAGFTDAADAILRGGAALTFSAG
jgi:tRNA1(Val) A37 N6-methylase TrmN6